MRIKKPKLVQWLFFLVTMAYLFDFGDIKYVMAALFAMIYLLRGSNGCFSLTNKGMGTGYITILSAILILSAITFLLQLINGFRSYAINEVIYFITPIFFVWTYIGAVEKKDISEMLDLIFIMTIGLFVFDHVIPVIEEGLVWKFDFMGSHSPFESGLGYAFLVYEVFYLSRRRSKTAALAMIMCVACFRRFAALMSVVFFVFGKLLIKKEKVSRRTVLFTTAVLVAIPVLGCIVVNDNFSNWFYSAFGISLSEFTLTRSDRIQMAVNSDEIKYGLGSTTIFMTDVFQEIHQSEVEQWNLHNDLIRIYLECGIIGSVAFTYCYLQACSFSKEAFFLMCYILAECFFNHLFGAGSVTFWISAYLVFSYMALPDKLNEGKDVHIQKYVAQIQV